MQIFHSSFAILSMLVLFVALCLFSFRYGNIGWHITVMFFNFQIPLNYLLRGLKFKSNSIEVKTGQIKISPFIALLKEIYFDRIFYKLALLAPNLIFFNYIEFKQSGLSSLMLVNYMQNVLKLFAGLFHFNVSQEFLFSRRCGGNIKKKIYKYQISWQSVRSTAETFY